MPGAGPAPLPGAGWGRRSVPLSLSPQLMLLLEGHEYKQQARVRRQATPNKLGDFEQVI